jgi:hypothetical protein
MPRPFPFAIVRAAPSVRPATAWPAAAVGTDVEA